MLARHMHGSYTTQYMTTRFMYTTHTGPVDKMPTPLMSTLSPPASLKAFPPKLQPTIPPTILAPARLPAHKAATMAPFRSKNVSGGAALCAALHSATEAAAHAAACAEAANSEGQVKAVAVAITTPPVGLTSLPSVAANPLAKQAADLGTPSGVSSALSMGPSTNYLTQALTAYNYLAPFLPLPAGRATVSNPVSVTGFTTATPTPPILTPTSLQTYAAMLATSSAIAANNGATAAAAAAAAAAAVTRGAVAPAGALTTAVASPAVATSAAPSNMVLGSAALLAKALLSSPDALTKLSALMSLHTNANRPAFVLPDRPLQPGAVAQLPLHTFTPGIITPGSINVPHSALTPINPTGPKQVLLTPTTPLGCFPTQVMPAPARDPATQSSGLNVQQRVPAAIQSVPQHLVQTYPALTPQPSTATVLASVLMGASAIAAMSHLTIPTIALSPELLAARSADVKVAEARLLEAKIEAVHVAKMHAFMALPTTTAAEIANTKAHLAMRERGVAARAAAEVQLNTTTTAAASAVAAVAAAVVAATAAVAAPPRPPPPPPPPRPFSAVLAATAAASSGVPSTLVTAKANGVVPHQRTFEQQQLKRPPAGYRPVVKTSPTKVRATQALHATKPQANPTPPVLIPIIMPASSTITVSSASQHVSGFLPSAAAAGPAAALAAAAAAASAAIGAARVTSKLPSTGAITAKEQAKIALQQFRNIPLQAPSVNGSVSGSMLAPPSQELARGMQKATESLAQLLLKQNQQQAALQQQQQRQQQQQSFHQIVPPQQQQQQQQPEIAAPASLTTLPPLLAGSPSKVDDSKVELQQFREMLARRQSAGGILRTSALLSHAPPPITALPAVPSPTAVHTIPTIANIPSSYVEPHHASAATQGEAAVQAGQAIVPSDRVSEVRKRSGEDIGNGHPSKKVAEVDKGDAIMVVKAVVSSPDRGAVLTRTPPGIGKAVREKGADSGSSDSDTSREEGVSALPASGSGGRGQGGGRGRGNWGPRSPAGRGLSGSGRGRGGGRGRGSSSSPAKPFVSNLVLWRAKNKSEAAAAALAASPGPVGRGSSSSPVKPAISNLTLWRARQKLKAAATAAAPATAADGATLPAEQEQVHHVIKDESVLAVGDVSPAGEIDCNAHISLVRVDAAASVAAHTAATKAAGSKKVSSKGKRALAMLDLPKWQKKSKVVEADLAVTTVGGSAAGEYWASFADMFGGGDKSSK